MNLQLSLIGKWFKMSDDLIKTEDYRDINDYWIKRLIDKNFSWNCQTLELIQQHLEACPNGFWKKFTKNTITLGYPKKGDLSRISQFEHAGIEIRTGKPEWGAEPNKIYFVIKHGQRIE